MKGLIYILTLLLFQSCSLKDSIDNNFKTKSRIDSMEKAETLAETYGDGELVRFKVKIPLTEASLSYYDIEEILGHEQLDSSKKEFVGSFLDTLKFSLFNLFVKLGRSNSIKISSFLQFPKIDPKYIKGAYVKKVFFTTEDCRPSEESCNDLDSLGSNFNLLDKVMVNISGNNDPNDIETKVTELSKKRFNKIYKKTQEQKKITRNELFKQNFDGRYYNNVNLVSLDNETVLMNSSINKMIKVEESPSTVLYKTLSNEKEIIKYLKSKKFSTVVENVDYSEKYRFNQQGSVKKEIKGVAVNLKRGKKPQDLYNLISKQRPPLTKKMLILRLNDNFVAAKKYVKSPKFKRIVNDATIIGRSLYIELKNKKSVDSLENALRADQLNSRNILDIYKIETCDRSNCLDLEVSNVNLARILEKSENIKLDTYLKVKNLRKSDFKYNGYIEVELLLDLPI